MDINTQPTLNLSPSVSYYIRKLLRQNLDQLKFVATIGAKIKADPFTDLNAALIGLTQSEAEMRDRIRHLERLVTTHQALARKQSLYGQEIADLEQEIFGLLGLFRHSLVARAF